MYQLEFLTTFSTLWCITISAPSSPPPTILSVTLPTTLASTNIQNTNPNLFQSGSDAISIEGLNYLVRSPGNFFRPPLIIPDIPVGATHIDYESSSLSLPSSHKSSSSPNLSQYQQEGYYNFYIPLDSYENLDNDKDNKYHYLENDDKNHQALLNIFPPDITNNNEPNYYELQKPKKVPKKYTSTLKLINVKNMKNQNEFQLPNASTVMEEDATMSTTTSLPQNHRYSYDDAHLNINHQIIVPDISQDHNVEESRHKENYSNDNDDAEIQENEEKQEHEEQRQQEQEERDEEQEQQQQEEHLTKLNIPIKYNNDGSERIEYQIHGHNGPKSYKFGYDTGKGKNRQYRFEERDNTGNVMGEYGYIDKLGELVIIKYTSDIEKGFQVENLH